jgi:4-hydroxybutyrate dehydrogenase
MNIITFSFPTPTLFGAGAVAELPARLLKLGVQRPLVVTDPGLPPTVAFNLLRRALGAAGQGNQWFLYAGVHPNPVESDVFEAAQAYREHHCDGVIAIGGGSPLDAGKAARLLIKRPDLKFAAYDYTADWSGLAPLVCIPTTAGTGSEVGRSSVITLAETHRKKVIFHPELLAKLVILDPELTRELPPKLTAATGADALTHCIESFTCPTFHPMCDGIALEGIHLIIEALPKAFHHGADLDARGKLLAAAAMGAVSFQKDLGATHSLAHPLSTICGMHHGLANALCLVAVMRFNARRKPGLYRRVGLACGLDVVKVADAEADRLTIEFLAAFLADLGLNKKLRDFGVQEEHLAPLTAQAFEDPCHQTNAVPVTADDLRELYLSVF